MKKVLLALAFASLLLVLVGCVETDEDYDDDGLYEEMNEEEEENE